MLLLYVGSAAGVCGKNGSSKFALLRVFVSGTLRFKTVFILPVIVLIDDEVSLVNNSHGTVYNHFDSNTSSHPIEVQLNFMNLVCVR